MVKCEARSGDAGVGCFSSGTLIRRVSSQAPPQSHPALSLTHATTEARPWLSSPRATRGLPFNLHHRPSLILIHSPLPLILKDRTTFRAEVRRPGLNKFERRSASPGACASAVWRLHRVEIRTALRNTISRRLDSFASVSLRRACCDQSRRSTHRAFCPVPDASPQLATSLLADLPVQHRSWTKRVFLMLLGILTR
jgi:hypothetical protein